MNTLCSQGAAFEGIRAEHTQYNPYLEITKDHSFSISGSLFNPVAGLTDPRVFSTWNAHIGHHDHEILGETVVRDDHYNFGVVAPVYHQEAGSQLANNWSLLSKAWQTASAPEVKTIIKPQVIPEKTQAKKPPISDNTEEMKNDNSDWYTLYLQSQEIPPLLDMEELQLTSHESEFLTNHTNFGIVAEVVKHDIESLEGWNHSFQKLLKSSSMEIYLSEAQYYLGPEAAFNSFVKEVFNPFAELMFYDKTSYLYPMYAHFDGEHFLSREVLEQADIPSMVERIGQDIDSRVGYYAKLAGPLRSFYIFSVILEDNYQYAKGRSLFPLIKEEAYSTIGAVTCASFASEFTATVERSSRLLSESVFGKEIPPLCKILGSS